MNITVGFPQWWHQRNWGMEYRNIGKEREGMEVFSIYSFLHAVRPYRRESVNDLSAFSSEWKWPYVGWGKDHKNLWHRPFSTVGLQLNDVLATLGWVNPLIVSAVTSMMKFASPDTIQGNIEVQIVILFMNCNSVVCRTWIPVGDSYAPCEYGRDNCTVCYAHKGPAWKYMATSCDVHDVGLVWHCMTLWWASATLMD